VSEIRQSGRTTQQMNDAPTGAVFVWCNGRVTYPQALAKALGRDDLTVRPLSWLEPRNVMGRNFPGVVVDHAAQPDTKGYEALHYLRLRGVPTFG
jgi:hypothetical protein